MVGGELTTRERLRRLQTGGREVSPGGERPSLLDRLAQQGAEEVLNPASAPQPSPSLTQYSPAHSLRRRYDSVCLWGWME